MLSIRLLFLPGRAVAISCAGQGTAAVFCCTLRRSAAESIFGDEEERLGGSKLVDKMRKRKSRRRIVDMEAVFFQTLVSASYERRKV